MTTSWLDAHEFCFRRWLVLTTNNSSSSIVQKTKTSLAICESLEGRRISTMINKFRINLFQPPSTRACPTLPTCVVIAKFSNEFIANYSSRIIFPPGQVWNARQLKIISFSLEHIVSSAKFSHISDFNLSNNISHLLDCWKAWQGAGGRGATVDRSDNRWKVLQVDFWGLTSWWNSPVQVDE